MTRVLARTLCSTALMFIVDEGFSLGVFIDFGCDTVVNKHWADYSNHVSDHPPSGPTLPFPRLRFTMGYFLVFYY